MKVFKILDEALCYQTSLNKSQRRDEIHNLLDMVNLSLDAANSYPWQLSGGQRRRIGIARTLVGNPKLIVADEPVAALDVSVQAQILNLLKSLQERKSVAYLLISHDLSVIKYMSHRIAVMYRGRIVELADAELIKTGMAAHPYTKELLLSADIEKSLAEELKYEQEPEMDGVLHGCTYHPRCLLCKTLGIPHDCKTEPPTLEPVADVARLREQTPATARIPMNSAAQHFVACHHYSDAIQLRSEEGELMKKGSREEGVKEHRIPFESTTSEISKSAPSEVGKRSERSPSRSTAESGKRRTAPAYFARLFITKGANRGKEFELPTEEGMRITIGRRIGSDIHLPYDEIVSRVHAAIRVQESTHKLFDLDSKHGTFLYRDGEAGEKQRIERPETLASKDIIEVGHTQLAYIKAEGIREDKEIEE